MPTEPKDTLDFNHFMLFRNIHHDNYGGDHDDLLDMRLLVDYNRRDVVGVAKTTEDADKIQRWHNDKTELCRRAYDRVVEAARQLCVMFGCSSAGVVEDFEERVEMFRRDTGKMAPGKSIPRSCAPSDSGTQYEYHEWAKKKISELRDKIIPKQEPANDD